MEHEDSYIQQHQIRSYEVQELLGQVPRWIMRWGTLAVVIAVAVLFLFSVLLSYPDIIPSQVTLTANIPPAELKAYSNGSIIKIFVHDQQKVVQGQLLAVIHSSANYQDVLRLNNTIADTFSIEQILNGEIEMKGLNLGDIQTSYSAFINTLEEYKSFVDIDYYRRKLKTLQVEYDKYNDFIKSILQKEIILKKEFQLRTNQYLRDSSLAAQGVISQTDLEKAEEKRLEKQYELQEVLSQISEARIQLSKIEQQKTELELQLEKQNQKLYSDIKSRWYELRGAIAAWRKNYCIVSPITGIVSLSKIWSENQYVSQGEVVMNIVPERYENLFGRITLQSEGVGKVKAGNKVIIRFDNYPYLEYGVVSGRIASLSLTPDNGIYYAQVRLDSTSLVSSYGVALTFSQNMKGSAQIITENRSLFDRIVAPFRSAAGLQGLYRD